MIYSFDERFAREQFEDVVALVNFALQRQKANGAAWQVTLGNPNAPIGPAVLARVEAGLIPGHVGYDGRWMADCPIDGCAGGEYVSFHRPVFMCCSCWNAEVGGQWRVLWVPDQELRAGIDALLMLRDGKQRNWTPPETLDDLRMENEILLSGALS